MTEGLPPRKKTSQVWEERERTGEWRGWGGGGRGRGKEEGGKKGITDKYRVLVALWKSERKNETNLSAHRRILCKDDCERDRARGASERESLGRRPNVHNSSVLTKAH